MNNYSICSLLKFVVTKPHYGEKLITKRKKEDDLFRFTPRSPFFLYPFCVSFFSVLTCTRYLSLSPLICSYIFSFSFYYYVSSFSSFRLLVHFLFFFSSFAFLSFFLFHHIFPFSLFFDLLIRLLDLIHFSWVLPLLFCPFFLNATTHLFKRSYRSVRPSASCYYRTTNMAVF